MTNQEKLELQGTDFNSYSNEQLNRLSASTWDSLSASTLNRLSASTWDSLSASTLNSLSASTLNRLSASTLNRLSASTWDSLSASTIFSKIKSIDPIEKIYTKLLAKITSQGCYLDMSTWHTCETVHCEAGWIVTMHPMGIELENFFGSTPFAAKLILQKSAPNMPLPNFYCDNESAMAFINARVKEENN